MRSHIRNQGIAAEGVFYLIGVGQQQTDFDDGPMVDLISEMELYGDFIIGDYVDSYRNLTLKTFSGYKYVHESCSEEVKWILFQDDDTIIAERKFQELLLSTSETSTCLAEKYSGATVIRTDSRRRSEYEKEHYSVSREEYALDRYPIYCGGPCALISRVHLDKIYEVAKVTNPGKFTIEDVLFTGIMRMKANVTGPNDARGVCAHYNSVNKHNEIRYWLI